jgi:hypothetical protein
MFYMFPHTKKESQQVKYEINEHTFQFPFNLFAYYFL